MDDIQVMFGRDTSKPTEEANYRVAFLDRNKGLPMFPVTDLFPKLTMRAAIIIVDWEVKKNKNLNGFVYEETEDGERRKVYANAR